MPGCRVEQVAREGPDLLYVAARGTRPGGRCPDCERASRGVHSRYRRRPADLPSLHTLHSSFARWTRLGLWRRLGQRLALDWGLAHGDEVLPSAMVDSRSLRSAPSAWARGTDAGKPGKREALPMVKGLKLLVVCDKHGSLLDLELHPANTDDRTRAVLMLPRLAGFYQNSRQQQV